MMVTFIRKFRTIIVLLPLLLVAARCVDNTTLVRDEAGNWHIFGEIHNETDIQGVEMILGATLYDAAGNVLATGQAGICPGELSPHQFSAFDITFHNSDSIPQPARYEVRALSGRALTSPLPELDVVLRNMSAKRSGDRVTVTGTIRANRQYDGDFSGCAAFYDPAGKVVQQVTIIGFGGLEEDVNQPLELPLPLVPGTASTVRFWIVGPGNDPFESDYQAVVSGAINIQ